MKENNLKFIRKGRKMQKQSYEQVFENFKKLDYEVLVKAVFLFSRDDLLELDKETRDDILGKACDFYLNCDLGSFVDERLLDELDSLKNDILGGSDES